MLSLPSTHDTSAARHPTTLQLEEPPAPLLPTAPPSTAMATLNWRTINIDALDPDSPANFDLSTLTPAIAPVSTADVQSLAGQIRQLLRGGDSQGALQGALENPPYGADQQGKVCHGMPLPRRCRNTALHP